MRSRCRDLLEAGRGLALYATPRPAARAGKWQEERSVLRSECPSCLNPPLSWSRGEPISGGDAVGRVAASGEHCHSSPK